MWRARPKRRIHLVHHRSSVLLSSSRFACTMAAMRYAGLLAGSPQRGIRPASVNQHPWRWTMNRMLLPAAVIAAFLAQPLLAHEDDAAAGQSQFGKVNFPTSCSAAVQPQFERAVAMLHSFFFPEHIKAFQAVIAAEPGCAMAYWGLAISERGNPLVPPWPAENLKRALDA